MYKGLPIITNKITIEERRGIPHHLLGIVELDQEPWRVGLFKKKAGSIIEEIRSRGKLPILVGGTHYYTQSLLFKETLVSDAAQSEGEIVEGLSREEINRRYPILEKSTEEILEQLRVVDPVMADRWHPNDRRRIQRSLEIYLMTGKPASRAYEEQRERRVLHQSKGTRIGTSEAEVASLLQSTLFFWVHADSKVLSKRLEGRVENMLKIGLIDEVKALDMFLYEQTIAGISVDRSSGIWASIGFKEFESYITALKTGALPSKELHVSLATAVEKTKIATRQYAKRQIRWIRLKLLAALSKAHALSSLYILDGSDFDQWSACVSGPAIDIVRKFLAQEELPSPRNISPAMIELLVPKQAFEFCDRRDLWIRRTCELCDVTAVTDDQWQRHTKGRGHRRAVKKSQKNASRNSLQARDDEVTE